MSGGNDEEGFGPIAAWDEAAEITAETGEPAVVSYNADDQQSGGAITAWPDRGIDISQNKP